MVTHNRTVVFGTGMYCVIIISKYYYCVSLFLVFQYPSFTVFCFFFSLFSHYFLSPPPPSSSFFLFLSYQACTSRDSLAKALYAAAFDFIVQQINRATSPPSHKDKREEKREGTWIGILDIVGFEILDQWTPGNTRERFTHPQGRSSTDLSTVKKGKDTNKNSFEQLIINYANEVLQHAFIQHVFLQEQQVRKRRGKGEGGRRTRLLFFFSSSFRIVYFLFLLFFFSLLSSFL